MPSNVENVDSPADAESFPRFLRACAARYGDTVAVDFEGRTLPNETLTFAELERRSAALAKGLLARGVGKGSRVGFQFGNGPGFVVTLAAIARIGAVAIPLSTLLRGAEIGRVLRRSDIGGLIVQRRLLGRDMVAQLAEAVPDLVASDGPVLHVVEAPYLRWIVSSGPDLPHFCCGEDMLEAAAGLISDDLLAAVEADVSGTDQMIEIYTSGSMAEPKGARHDHGPVLRRIRYMAGMVAPKRGDAEVVPLPMFWVGGLGLGLMVNLALGIRTLCSEATSTDSRAARGSVISAEELAARSAAKPFWSLGMTETFGPYAHGDVLRAEGEPLAPPLDHIADGFEVRLVGANGVPTADGEVGEIQVRGDGLTSGLHKTDRAETFTVDGYLRTGDLGRRHGDRIHFAGRDGDMIKSAKANVSPAEVEMELQRLDGVDCAYVVGLPDADRGQIVAAALVPGDGVKLDFARIEADLRGRLSGYKVPRVYVALRRDDVPMLPSNKVARRELTALLAQHGKTAGA